jgi:hypothetical protein
MNNHTHVEQLFEMTCICYFLSMLNNLFLTVLLVLVLLLGCH